MEKLTINLFGVLTEIAETEQVEIEVSNNLRVDQLASELKMRYPAMALVQFTIAVNNTLTHSGVCTEKDKIDVMPPFAGG